MRMIKYLCIVALTSLFLVSCGEDGSYNAGGGSYGNDNYYNDGESSILRVINSNASTDSICNLYSVPSSSGSWGSDKLHGTLPPGYHKDLVTHNCNRYYDVKVVFCDGWAAETSYYRECGHMHEVVARNW